MAQQPQHIQPGSDYTVQTGDTLWDIAQRVYNHQEDWATIYNANKQVIGDNPDLIHPGQVLHIPLQPDISIRKPPPTTLPPPVGLNNGQPSADLGQPSHWVINFIWITIISVFAIVFVMSAVAIVVSIWYVVPTNGKTLGDVATLVTIFSTAVGFLAGILTPTPVGKPGTPKPK